MEKEGMIAWETEPEKTCMPWPKCEMAKVRVWSKAMGLGTKEEIAFDIPASESIWRQNCGNNNKWLRTDMFHSHTWMLCGWHQVKTNIDFQETMRKIFSMKLWIQKCSQKRGFFSKSSRLIMDAMTAHKEESVKKMLNLSGCHIAIIPGGLSSKLQLQIVEKLTDLRGRNECRMAHTLTHRLDETGRPCIPRYARGLHEHGTKCLLIWFWVALEMLALSLQERSKVTTRTLN